MAKLPELCPEDKRVTDDLFSGKEVLITTSSMSDASLTALASHIEARAFEGMPMKVDEKNSKAILDEIRNSKQGKKEKKKHESDTESNGESDGDPDPAGEVYKPMRRTRSTHRAASESAPKKKKKAVKGKKK